MPNKVGRPPLKNWTDRKFYRALDTHGSSTNACWLPKPGERVNPNAQVSVEADGEWKKTTVRRFLFTEVMREEDDHWTELLWDDVVVAADSCTSSACLNPWHQIRLTRAEHAEMMRARWEQGQDGKEAAVGAVGETRKQAQIANAAARGFRRYVAGRLVLLGTGNAEWATEVEGRRDSSDAMADELRRRLLAAYPRYAAAFDAVPGGSGHEALRKRREIVRHFWRLYPETEEMVEEAGGNHYLEMAWSNLR